MYDEETRVEELYDEIDRLSADVDRLLEARDASVNRANRYENWVRLHVGVRAQADMRAAVNDYQEATA